MKNLFKWNSVVMLLCGVLMFASCEKDKKVWKLTTTNLSVVAGSKSQIIISPDAMGFDYVSTEPLIASVDPSGLVTGNIVGETTILVTNEELGFSEECLVKVTPKYNMYREPSFDFGCSMSSVKAYESRTLLKEIENGLLYEGENSRIDLLLYSFKYDAYNASAVYVPYSEYNTESLVDFLSERYIMTTDDDTILFGNVDNTVIGALTATVLNGAPYFQVMYMEWENAANANTRGMYNFEAFEEMSAVFAKQIETIMR